MNLLTATIVILGAVLILTTAITLGARGNSTAGTYEGFLVHLWMLILQLVLAGLLYWRASL